MAQQKTYTMIKPDGVRNGHIGEIVNRFERAGLKIERMELGMVTDEQAKANYAEHEGKPFYDGLISYITSGPVVKMVVSGDGAVAKCRSLMGATNPAEAAPARFAAISASSWTRMSSMAPIPRNPPSARSASSSRKARSERAAAYEPFARATARFLFFGASRTEGCAGYQTRKGREHALSSHRRC